MRGLIATVVVLGLMGCVRLMGDDGDELIDGAVNPPDLTRDQSLTDHPLAPLDGPQTKLDGPQTKHDGPQTKPDGPVPDAPKSDGPQIVLDGTLPKPDKGGSVCTPGATATSVGFKAVLCVSSTLSYDQCNAHNLCNAGTASLCAAGAYQNRVKASVNTAAWIAGCVRSGVTPFAPKNAACSTCTSFVTTNTLVAWPCTAKVVGVQSTYSHLGLVSHGDCSKVGVDLVSTEGYWKTSPAGTKLSASICCY